MPGAQSGVRLSPGNAIGQARFAASVAEADRADGGACSSVGRGEYRFSEHRETVEYLIILGVRIYRYMECSTICGILDNEGMGQTFRSQKVVSYLLRSRPTVLPKRSC